MVILPIEKLSINEDTKIFRCHWLISSIEKSFDASLHFDEHNLYLYYIFLWNQQMEIVKQ